MFADAFAKAPKDCELAAVIEAARTGRYAAQVARLRELRAVTPEALPERETQTARVSRFWHRGEPHRSVGTFRLATRRPGQAERHA